MLIGVNLFGSLQAQASRLRNTALEGDGGTDYLTAEPGHREGVRLSRLTCDGNRRNKATVIVIFPGHQATHGIAPCRKVQSWGSLRTAVTLLSQCSDLNTLTVLKKIKIPVGVLTGLCTMITLIISF